MSEPDLLATVESFLQENPVAASRLGRDAVGDPSFVRELRSGRVVRPGTADRVRRYIQGRATP